MAETNGRPLDLVAQLGRYEALIDEAGEGFADSIEAYLREVATGDGDHEGALGLTEHHAQTAALAFEHILDIEALLAEPN